ncbi:hypothetical protein GWO09_06035, partial [candidate division KSB1 bacterium]|nr:hypothetical protein [candidate division KSB1 bacterium]
MAEEQQEKEILERQVKLNKRDSVIRAAKIETQRFLQQYNAGEIESLNSYEKQIRNKVQPLLQELEEPFRADAQGQIEEIIARQQIENQATLAQRQTEFEQKLLEDERNSTADVFAQNPFNPQKRDSAFADYAEKRKEHMVN